MKNLKDTHKKDILVLNTPHIVSTDSFYFKIFRVPEILNRLKQYRQILSENDLNIPLWVYNLTQDLNIVTEGHKPYILNFLVNLGFFDRYVAKNGWPKYIIGTDPLMSVITDEISYEEQALLLTQGYCQPSEDFQLYQAKSYYNTKTSSFYLTSLRKEEISGSFTSLYDYLNEYEDLQKDWYLQLLSPHEDSFMDQLQSRGIFVRDFLSSDSSLRWLWPVWKKSQISKSKNAVFAPAQPPSSQN